MHPTLTQVPPIPQVVPLSDGITKSKTTTFFPKLVASLAHANPPDPPPITKRSKSYWPPKQ